MNRRAKLKDKDFQTDQNKTKLYVVDKEHTLTQRKVENKRMKNGKGYNVQILIIKNLSLLNL